MPLGKQALGNQGDEKRHARGDYAQRKPDEEDSGGRLDQGRQRPALGEPGEGRGPV